MGVFARCCDRSRGTAQTVSQLVLIPLYFSVKGLRGAATPELWHYASGSFDSNHVQEAARLEEYVIMVTRGACMCCSLSYVFVKAAL